MRRNRPARRGALLIAVCVAMFLFAAAAGLMLDVSRMMLIQKELKVRTDAAALAGAVELDGTAAGLERARMAASSEAGSATIEFAGGDQWTADPADPAAITQIRVAGSVPVPLTLVRIVVRQDTAHVSTRSTARMGEGATLAELVR
ncbi:MAG: pilus assembly protein TadG-related protein [Bryobacteraceae bacterium]